VGAPSRVVFATQPVSTTAGQLIPTVTAAIHDSAGNLVPVTADITIAAILGGGGTLGGTTTVSAVNGVVSFTDLFINQAGHRYQLEASSAGLAHATSAAFDIRVGPAAALAFVAQPTHTQAGSAIAPVQVAIQDAAGNTVTTAFAPITLALGANAAGGSLSGNVTAGAVNGVATFANLSIGKAGAGYTLAASSATLSGESTAFDITVGAASQLAFRTTPVNAVAGSTLNQVEVEVRDASGNLTAAAVDITLALGGATGTLNGTATVTSSNGVAVFADLSINQAATGFTLTASAAGLASSTSPAFDISAGAASALAFSVQPSDTRAGVNITPAVKVAIQDALGNVVSTNANVTVALGNNPGSGTLSGTTTVAAVNGVATFADLSINRRGNGYTLVASSGSAPSVTSAGFNVRSGTAAALVYKVGPANTIAGTVIGPLELEVQDALGNVVSDANGTLSLTLNGTAALGGTTSATVTSGVATFADLFITRAAAGYKLVAHLDGVSEGTSVSFDVAPDAASKLAFAVQPGITQAGSRIGPSIRVAIQDRYDNVVTGANDTVTLALDQNPANASLNGTTSVAAVDGVATFNDVTLNRAAGGYSLKASTSALSAISSRFDISAGPPAKLVFKTGPAANLRAGAAMEPVSVELQDALGNVLTQNTSDVTVSLGANPAGGVLFGTATAKPVDGVATFDGLNIRKAGTGYSLVATAAGFSGATSEAFAIAPGAAASYTVALPASVTAGQEVTLSATAYDAYGNVATAYAGSARVASSDITAQMPANKAFSAGELADLKVTFKTTGLRTLTLSDVERDTIKGEARTNVTPFPQPTVSITDPAGGSTVTGKVSITVSGAVAPGTTLTQLAILVDGQVIASGAQSTLTGEWDSSKAQKGSTHTITAVISDGAGNIAYSAPVGVIANNGSCGCGSTSGADASVVMALLAMARYMAVRRRRKA